MTLTTEKTFEENIESSLVESGGFIKGDKESYQADLALDVELLLQFIKTSQPDEWQQLLGIHGQDVQEKFIARLTKELENKGMLQVLRYGIDDYGVHFNLAYFKPESKLNAENVERYEQNILSVTRQVHFSVKDSNLSVDMVLFVNGLPVATVELKNPFTRQDVSDAKNQFAYTRDQNETLFRFKKRALVHFAVDPNEVYMTTKLNGEDTKFLPFNKGCDGGAGNPNIEGNYKTAYLWEEVLKKDSLMEIIKKFVHLEVKEIKVGDKIKTKETMVFPRYHQLDVVRKIVADTKQNGVGKNYLIQHSAGSGKSNSIAWLSYRLASLHDETDTQMFDSVIVVTDRIVLDQQLQDTIYQFDHKLGVVEK
jgi:type I restriction enzyme, R subunit